MKILNGLDKRFGNSALWQFVKFNLVGHQMVGRCDHDVGFLAARLDVVGSIGDARCCIASGWLTKHLIRLEHRKVIQNELFIGFVGHHEEIFVGDDGTETFVGASDEAFTRA